MEYHTRNNKVYATYQDAERGEFGERGQRASEDLSPQKALLVYSGHKSPFKSDWSRKQRRLYHRTLSGFEFAKRFGDHVRILVLTQVMITAISTIVLRF